MHNRSVQCTTAIQHVPWRTFFCYCTFHISLLLFILHCHAQGIHTASKVTIDNPSDLVSFSGNPMTSANLAVMDKPSGEHLTDGSTDSRPQLDLQTLDWRERRARVEGTVHPYAMWLT